jgi:hypothetical protein
VKEDERSRADSTGSNSDWSAPYYNKYQEEDDMILMEIDFGE